MIPVLLLNWEKQLSSDSTTFVFLRGRLCSAYFRLGRFKNFVFMALFLQLKEDELFAVQALEWNGQ